VPYGQWIWVPVTYRRKCSYCESISEWFKCNYSDSYDDIDTWTYRCRNCDPSTELVKYEWEEHEEGEGEWYKSEEALICERCNEKHWFKKVPQIRLCYNCKPVNPDLKFNNYEVDGWSGWFIMKMKTSNGTKHYWISKGCESVDYKTYKCRCEKCNE
jgi:hypothetical protein